MSTNSRMLASIIFFFAGLAGLAATIHAEELIRTCIACHGENGISPTPAWPNLAGQKKGYLISQIKAFRDGERVNELMSPMVEGLNDEQIEKLAAHYAAMPAARKGLEGPEGLGRHVRARCISCHGREGVTVNPEWPNLAGQKAEYLQQQLLSYRAGTREHLLMRVIASELSDAEIKAVSEYFGQH